MSLLAKILNSWPFRTCIGLISIPFWLSIVIVSLLTVGVVAMSSFLVIVIDYFLNPITTIVSKIRNGSSGKIKSIKVSSKQSNRNDKRISD